ncbi:protein PERCC1 [Varanus komodoensis]|uniref:protein PERCC1 n=1 Tax=Varanus komodoensis TaxID=61221 RepID=UPI001CF7B411|nr:protein PERCC1 [Varanus komodoensis]
MTLQLLRFAEHISKDIQRYFGRKSKEQDADACNIYEDCCSPPWSAREQYYTDLLRVSQHGEPGRGEVPSGCKRPPLQLDQQLWGSLCSKDEAEKLGPLAELFEYGLCRCARQPASSGHKKLRLEHKYGHVAPMHGRKLPPSFWKEPSLSPLCVLSGNPPDFSDLLANWTSETSQEELHASRELAGEASGRAADGEHLGSL